MSEWTLLYRLKNLERVYANARRLVKDVVGLFPDALWLMTSPPTASKPQHKRAMHYFVTEDEEFFIDAIYYIRVSDAERGRAVTAVDVQVRNEDVGLLHSYKQRIEKVFQKYGLCPYETTLSNREPSINDHGVLIDGLPVIDEHGVHAVSPNSL